MKRLLISLPLLAAFAFGQAPPLPKADKGKVAPAAQALPPGVTDTITAYLLPDPTKLAIRDGQLEWDELEIDIQKMQVKIEQNKQRQKDISDAIRLQAYQFTQAKQIDLTLWELDPKQLKFVKKKAKATK
jgi:hypothetical protein